MAESVHAKKSPSQRYEKEAERVAEEERAIQREIDRSDKSHVRDKEASGAMQAGARLYPVPPLPDQHLSKPGTSGENRA